MLENRWIDIGAVPAAQNADFTFQSPNEWLVENVPFSGGNLVLECESQAALFNAERTTRNTQGATITFVQLVYAAGYRMMIEL